jgi:excisionase family DNA binding protein
VSYLRKEEGRGGKEYYPGMSTHVHEREEFLTPKELASVLRVDVASIYRAIARGDVPAVRLSQHGALRVHRSVLDQRKEQP